MPFLCALCYGSRVYSGFRYSLVTEKKNRHLLSITILLLSFSSSVLNSSEALHVLLQCFGFVSQQGMRLVDTFISHCFSAFSFFFFLSFFSLLVISSSFHSVFLNMYLGIFNFLFFFVFCDKYSSGSAIHLNFFMGR